tara:strand:+ start:3210 stop:4517 length:1308 start_codon:yes stop_codon:yes gene_type:complete
MGKISLVSAKYIIHAAITIEGVVDRPDVIGSVFGQTEGLLGSDLELRELQSSGRIGRIEVDINNKNGKTSGKISIPSSLDKTETALVAAAIETIQRIGPCNATVKVLELEDVRAAKRGQLIDRAKSLLSNLTHGTLPDSKDIKEKVSSAVRVADIVAYGKDKLPAGPEVETSEEVILVEGRADVINLLKHDIKNAVAMNGTSIPKTVIDMSKSKTVTVFVDGDRGGDLIIKELSLVAKIDYLAKAPDGKEVEEITHKEIHQALRAKIPFGTQKGRTSATSITRAPRTFDKDRRGPPERTRHQSRDRAPSRGRFESRGRFDSRDRAPRRSFEERPLRIPKAQKDIFSKLIDEITGKKEAYLLDNKGNILGKVPAKEISSTLEDIGKAASTIIIDGSLTKDLLESAENSRIRYLIGTKSYLKDVRSRVKVLTKKDLQ